ncbi:MAG: TetR/AcrR family transcriptional regulator [Solirubrobacterales bacterium]
MSLTVDHRTAQRVLDAAVQEFARGGYQGTSVRAVAARAGVSVRGLYAVLPSKQAMLAEVIDATYAALLSQVRTFVHAARADPAARLDAAVFAQCEFYARNPLTGAVARNETRSLAPAARRRVHERSLQLTDVFGEILADGVDAGVFDLDDPATAAHALVSMCEAIPAWYASGGSQSPRQLARTYCALAARMCGSDRNAASRRSARHLAVVATEHRLSA